MSVRFRKPAEQRSIHTAILALLRGLCLLCQAGVQPRGCLGIVTVECKKNKSQEISSVKTSENKETTAEAQAANKKDVSQQEKRQPYSPV